MPTNRTIGPEKPAGAPRTWRPRTLNRLRAVLPHVPWYSFEGQARLAADVGVSRSTITRLVNGVNSPSYALAAAVTEAVSRRLDSGCGAAAHHQMDSRELFSADGTYPTASACALCRCRGCMPDCAFGPDGSLRPEFRAMRPGDWSLSTSRVGT